MKSNLFLIFTCLFLFVPALNLGADADLFVSLSPEKEGNNEYKFMQRYLNSQDHLYAITIWIRYGSDTTEKKAAACMQYYAPQSEEIIVGHVYFEDAQIKGDAIRFKGEKKLRNVLPENDIRSKDEIYLKYDIRYHKTDLKKRTAKYKLIVKKKR